MVAAAGFGGAVIFLLTVHLSQCAVESAPRCMAAGARTLQNGRRDVVLWFSFDYIGMHLAFPRYVLSGR